MPAAPFQNSSYRPHASVRSRALATALSLAVTVLIIAMLIRVGALGPQVREVVPRLITIPLQPPPPPRASKQKKVDHTSRAAAPIHLPPRVPPLNMVIVTRKDFAASDIAKITSHPVSGTSSADAGASQGNSDGPNGEPIYNVAWYREPTHAEMAPYMPAVGPETGWAVIACRMIEHYHVEDCREMGESPAGSGLSRALRQASWQFLVRPPRVGGRSIIGGWVRIRYDITNAKAEN